MNKLGWKELDFILVTGDAYVDHPSFGIAIIARVLENACFKVGVIAQPDWKNDKDWLELGVPRLGFGISAGNLDSMVNHYTAQKKIRHNDAYSPDDKAGLRPDRATITYCNKVRQLFKNVPIIIGGVEASMRRIAHYDFWQDKVRNSILADSKADVLVYGMGEKAIVEIAQQLRNGIPVKEIKDIPGTVVFDTPVHSSDGRPHLTKQTNVWQTKEGETRMIKPPEGGTTNVNHAQAGIQPASDSFVLLPDSENCSDKQTFYQMTKLFQSNFQEKIIYQKVAGRYIRHNPPPEPLTEKGMDDIYALPFMRLPHPKYDGMTIPAFAQIKDSITSHRGCVGGCNFCTIGYHQGKVIQSRSEKSVLNEIKTLAKIGTFKGTVSDIGGPSANMFGINCKLGFPRNCKRNSCLYPQICSQLETSHKQIINLLQKALKIDGVEHVFVSSGIRFDLALKDEAYIKQIAIYHTGGLLKVAPEHTETNALRAMGKPGLKLYLDFSELFYRTSRQANKKNGIVPYIIAGHPGTTRQDATKLSQWLKNRNTKVEQVQEFTPTPMTISTCMYYTGLDFETGKPIYVPIGREVRLQKALIMWHDPNTQSRT